MKLLHFGDLHIGMTNYSRLNPETGLESRLEDFLKTFDLIADTAIKESVDAVIFAGDMYKTRDPSPTQQRGVGERIRKITKANIPVILVVGNHDTPNTDGKANTLDIYSALEVSDVYVFRIPELKVIETKSGPLQVVGFPWLQKSDFKELGDKAQMMYDKLDKQLPAIAVGHLEVEGASFGSEKGLAIANDVTTPLSVLTDRRLQYVALGHIHKHQVLSTDPLVVYSGSPERVDFGEEKEEKGFVIVDIKETAGKFEASFKFIDTNCRKFLSISLDLKPDDADPTKTILDEIAKHNVKDKIVRVSINIPADLDKEITMDKIKKSLTDANFIAGISRNVERKERQKIEGTEEVERLTPLEALQTYLKSKGISEDKQKELEKLATSLFE